ncbi:hypothetical protein BJY04DRAFT_180903 [Aspergillus karnatakaensis]|uniref:uncharacterized protein n=1 Tax=Aspergillus karnatakaensis TaxID=1810916 RepID=UPI003CCD10A6
MPTTLSWMKPAAGKTARKMRTAASMKTSPPGMTRRKQRSLMLQESLLPKRTNEHRNAIPGTPHRQTQSDRNNQLTRVHLQAHRLAIQVTSHGIQLSHKILAQRLLSNHPRLPPQVRNIVPYPRKVQRPSLHQHHGSPPYLRAPHYQTNSSPMRFKT